jgi:hypothetical protein
MSSILPKNAASIDARAGQIECHQLTRFDTGSCVVLSGLGFGFQLGSWPVWTFLAAAGIYVAWVVLYAEITVQTTRRPAGLTPEQVWAITVVGMGSDELNEFLLRGAR